MGILYLIGSMAASAIAGIIAMLIRMELSAIGPTITDNPTDYNVWLYFHGAAMLLCFQIPALTGFMANYFIPLMIGAKDVAFPRVNALSVWLFFAGIVLPYSPFLFLNHLISSGPDIRPILLLLTATRPSTLFQLFCSGLLRFSVVLIS
ncbi:MAG: cbb3-type cytochrome c oxidase subunit I [Candidatus Parabeggiatoa sp.]|nr:cbb3-type cytochrome c oxidase subunit I [Candidatus Parabeggiatoa sp.]